jgi:hypothetical protein
MWRALLIVVTLSSLSRGAHAHLPEPPDEVASIGPTLAYAHAPELGGACMYGVDAAVLHKFFWGGAGVRLFETLEADERKVLPYLEVGLWVLVNLGAGYTVDLNEGETNASGPHFFVGVPLPFAASSPGGVYYVEPYYRATYAEVGTLHEAGTFLKWASWD